MEGYSDRNLKLITDTAIASAPVAVEWAKESRVDFFAEDLAVVVSLEVMSRLCLL